MTTTTTTTTIEIPHAHQIRVSRAPRGAACEVHERPAPGLAEEILGAMATRGADGIVVCHDCFERGRVAHLRRQASFRAAVDHRSWIWPEGTRVRLWDRRWCAGVYEGEPRLTRTRSESWRVGPREYVLVEGELGGIDVRRLQVLADGEEPTS